MVSIPACHAGDPGSIPGLGVFGRIFFFFFFSSKSRIRTTELENSKVPRFGLTYQPTETLGLIREALVLRKRTNLLRSSLEKTTSPRIELARAEPNGFLI